MGKKFLRSVYSIALIFCLAAGLTISAHAQEGQTLRVGYVFTDGYQEGGEGEHKSGLGYDYYQKISYYTGWSYEYVYGGFGELLEKLMAGEIDIMGNLSYTDERAKSIDFSAHEQGTESYYLYTLKENDAVNESSLDALDGKRVGISKGSVQCGMFLDWCAKNGLECEVMEYSDRAEREADFNSGAIYATVVPTVMANDPKYAGWRAAVKIGASPYYFGLSKQCESSVKQQLDAALEAIFDANPNYFIDQFNKFYGGKMMESDFWTPEEQIWLTQHSNTIRVGYMDNYLPLSDADETGAATGLLASIADRTRDNLQLVFDCTAYTRYDEMKAALDRGELDAIFPVRGDYWAAEQQQLFLSDRVCGSNSVLLYTGEYSEEKTRRIAITDASPFQRYSTIICFPEAELVSYPSFDDCLEAVVKGKADSTISLNTYYKLNESRYANAKYFGEMELPDNANVCFGVQHGETMMLSISQKLLKIIGDDAINQALVSYSNFEREFTLRDYIEAHTVTFLLISAFVVLMIVFGSILYVKKATEQNRRLMEAAKDVERAERDLLAQEMSAEAYRLRTEKELSNSRIKLMITQMRPHFLYNALSAIQTIVKVDPDYASSLIFDFTTHLRSSITALGSDKLIPFSEELKNVTAYLNIEKMRTGDALHVIYDIQCDTFMVFPLSIQPFAENAARHGIYPKADEGGTITLRSWEREDAYVVQIQDDGVGFDVKEVMSRESQSVGLKNTIFRLKSLANAEVSIESEVGKGTSVTVVIPKEGESEGKTQ